MSISGDVHVTPGPSAKQEARLTLLLGFASPFAPNLFTSADSTAFLISSGFTQRKSGEFLSAVMAAPIFAHPVTADELTCSKTAL